MEYRIGKKKLTITILGLHAIFSILILINLIIPHFIGFSLLRSTFSLFYLSAVPGFLIVCNLNKKNIFSLNDALFSVGASLGILMVLGFLINITHPLLKNPISLLPLLVSLTCFIAFNIFIFNYNRNNTLMFKSPEKSEILNPQTLLFLLIPFISVFAVSYYSLFGSNIILISLLALISIFPALVLSGKLKKKYIPIAILSASIALLLHNTLIGGYLAWGNQQLEARMALKVISEGYWDASLQSLNLKYSMLRLSVLHPIYSILGGLSLKWVFKIVHPLTFSIVPVALYQSYKEYLPKKEAFLSSFLFMSLFSFYIVLSRATRTASAILFLSLFLLLISDKSNNRFKTGLLTILFLFSIIVSHYGASYLILFAIIVAIVLLKIDLPFKKKKDFLTTPKIGIFYISALFGWYAYVSGGKIFNSLIGHSRDFYQTLVTQLTSPASSSALQYVTRDWGYVVPEILTYLSIGLIAIIGIGAVSAFYKFYLKKERPIFDKQYLSYSLGFLIVLGSLVLPIERFNVARTLPICLVLLSPFLILGTRRLLKGVNYLSNRKIKKSGSLTFLGTFLIIYFLLNSGFVSATLTEDYSPNVLIDKNRILDRGTPPEKIYFYKQYVFEQTVEGSVWLRRNLDPTRVLYMSTWPGGAPMPISRVSSYTEWESLTRNTKTTALEPDMRLERESYIFLSHFVLEGKIVKIPTGHFEEEWIDTKKLKNLWSSESKIYANNKTKVYYSD
ncbi:hypothetical protein AKJ52_00090 [candidate division MSBL1 archaeon SCGC-AAA382C18]|uniref:DUF2206 domain-containing protein n=1 Tax=candidate division MSBL1 archaeon SCGC-AAA382C18 TaxID=1698281 RepID=A0A133VM03_9EURY|nr:hypothetical protein AKJ52_00090 [candidate division MSBL1 archaeon SCGC-AAA382C18]